ncbi:putative NAD/FAD-binding protein [Actinoplanes octamycinicus]|uniref:Putative NAD/FAD-binding protein n=1 Tax=Actinoplanes octamycinicus TaxID=135948 RepID=A0A7W7GVN1_9ACTN|nr:FAD-dependent oxidoreductase [Actinoplanes octamycinicus]MBB4739134.1 putative NAD/FAD-binding protein [Actinoplanes octamycinicus]GIE58891.1 NAD/FAD-binding protein [Actinoplanes octamycinicus]
MSTSVAVVGAGVAGLSTAYHLPEDIDVTVYEKNDYAGGHANTIEVDENGKRLGIDTAFVVFNARTYPQLSQFFADLGVATLDHQGGFNFFDVDSGLNYGTGELALDEDVVRAKYPQAFQTIWREAKRFHTEAPRDFLRGRSNVPLGEYLDRNGYSDEFKYSYVVLLATAVWSVPAELIWEMPATTVIAFYMSHDEGGLGGKSVNWKTVDGGSINYVRRIVESIRGRVRLSEPVIGIRDDGDRVVVTSTGGAREYDYVVLATHADEALKLLERPTGEQQRVLETVRYSATKAVLHTDPAVLPADRSRWQSWNYGKKTVDDRVRTWVAYYMNPLQDLDAERDYFVTLDCPVQPRDETVLKEIDYTHPVIDLGVRAMQKTIYDVNRTGRIKLAGSYFHSPKIGPDLVGSHEAAFVSGLHAARRVEVARQQDTTGDAR